MNKLAMTLLLFLFPGLVLADGSLNFAPPASDYSVVFLGNLFGVVDGVLSGTGSQIMGNIFGVFNASVLAIGGVIILYTLIVATMNTAHEGQMLGQKWSSIWIPLRAVIGLALLIPKASGYCLMQIFVMWVVIQGVGAADKVWNSALSYLNRGGVIIQAQQSNPASQLTKPSSAGIGGIATGAEVMLAGQVCMLGLQTQLQNIRQSNLDQQAKNTGPCKNATPGDSMDQFCKTVVPDFLSSVNAVTVQNAKPTQASWSVPMPNFDSGPYSILNGICGTISWNSITQNASFRALPKNENGINTGSTTTNNTLIKGINLTPSDVALTFMSRSIAIQQMYSDLTSVARSIVSNDPEMSKTNNSNTSQPDPAWANQPFGIPYTQTGSACQQTKNDCVVWGPVPGKTSGTLFTGVEVSNAIHDYNGIMMPTINLARMINNTNDNDSATKFISEASTQGWIMAGAYYFNLVKIQGTSSATENSNQVDSDTGLDQSTMDPFSITSPFPNNDGLGSSNCNPGNQKDSDFTHLCDWLGGDSTPLKKVQSLLALNLSTDKLPVISANMDLKSGSAASTVYGFLNNSLMMTSEQPGTKSLTFADNINFKIRPDIYELKRQTFSCGAVKPYYTMCLGSIIGNIVYNLIIVTIYNIFIGLFGSIIATVIGAFLEIPLKGMAQIFQGGLGILTQSGVNPVVALANMGNQYINFAGNLWMYLLGLAVSSALIPVFGVFIFAMLTLAMPLVIAWVGVMVSIGFVTAYYIPILPYIIFVFGGLGWMIAVIEAMVAAPIVALGITHPEGHDAFGKGEAAIMLLLNIFLRPAMMIIGYIAAIALSYVGVWLLNAGFDQAISFVSQESGNNSLLQANIVWESTGGGGKFSDWTAVYAFFFSILSYTTVYLTIVQKSFTLITHLPDKVLRWIGGTPESIGQESAQWGEEAKNKTQEAGKETQQAQGTMEKTMGGMGMKAVGKAKGAMSKAFGGEGSSQSSGNSPQLGPDSKSGDSGTGGSGSSSKAAPPITK